MPLIDYQDIDDSAKKHLLVGNGFSIGVSKNFSYTSLFELCQRENYLLEEENELFDKFNSKDFEFVLNRLDIAILVNKILGINHDTLLTHYDNIRETLIKSVSSIHPSYENIYEQWIFIVLEEFKEFKKIFTTNYDLLIYWIISSNDFQGFCDYFWSIGSSFNQFNTAIRGGKKPILYLHGNLFIYKELANEENQRIIKKVKAEKNALLLESIINQWNDGAIPIFISEGTSDAKLRSIKSDPYLTFVYSELLEIQEGITIFGHSLSDTDKHIVSAINENDNLKHIAISIYRGSKTEDEIEHEISCQRLKFSEKSLQFFDSSTCPLSYPISPSS